jgi:RNA polymerase sigma factor (sigma-70 family)
MAAPEAQPALDPITTFFHRIRPRLLRLLSRAHIPALDREDLLQDALVDLVVQWSRIEHPEAWLLGTLRNKSLSYLRNQRRGFRGRCVAVGGPEDLERLAGPVPADELDQRLDLACLARALPVRQQRILWLYYGLGLSERELLDHLAAKRPTSVQTLRKDRWRAILRLRRALLNPPDHPE